MERSARLSRAWIAAVAAVAALGLAACGGGGSALPTVPPPAPSLPGVGVVDASADGCVVSYDGMLSYTVPAGAFSPIDIRSANCGAGLDRNPNPPLPAWAIPDGPTQAIFVATSLQQAYSVAGMQSLETAAAASHVPMTWMIDNFAYLQNTALYQSYHADNGDDVEAGDEAQLVAQMRAAFPWYTPSVSVEGGGHERNIAGLTALGETGFWGITWDSRGTDGDYDVGAPWGSYCADPSSYKRPMPDGTCPLLAFEWTARDLTRGYLSGHTEFYSTDPDDLQQRAGFSTGGAIAYIQAVADAYAAAGETQPLVMMSQQESAEDLNPGDEQIMAALYARAVHDGMKTETLAQANTDARAFSAQPRAVAFPFIAGGLYLPSDELNGGTLYPATIDYHDAAVGMTFLAGHTVPTRVFEYASDPLSQYNVPFAPLAAAETPQLTSVAVQNGAITFHFDAPVALRYGVALWSNPAVLRMSGSGVTPAGRAGVVLTFQLQAGANDISFPCPGCSGTTLPYST